MMNNYNSDLISWDDIVENAKIFHLSLKDIEELKDFFLSLDQTYFAKMAKLVTTKFPKDEVINKFQDKDLYRFLFLVAIANGNEMANIYKTNNWPNKMFDEISKDFTLWIDIMKRDLGCVGVNPRLFDWLKGCVDGSIKQFGRLQANDVHYFSCKEAFYRDANGKLSRHSIDEEITDKEKVLFFKDPTINLHIPGSGPLNYIDCIKSIKEMVEFVEKYNPSYDYKAIVCYSWILDKQFENILKKDSNILKFQKLGHVFPLPYIPQTKEVVWRVFGKCNNDKNYAALPRNNSMQKAVAQFLENGGEFHEGLLIILKDELPALFEQIKSRKEII